MSIGKLTLLRGQEAIVDAEDLPGLLGFTWYLDGNGYVGRSIGSKRAYLHRQVMKAGKGELIDHRNRNRLDNRKENLRVATQSENSTNSVAHRDSVSKFKGVYFRPERNKWTAEIMKDGKKKRLGCFTTEKQAAIAYDREAILLHGKFARLNFPRSLCA